CTHPGPSVGPPVLIPLCGGPRPLLGAGSRPDTAGAQGLPVLCTAVAAFAHRIAEALVEAGADPDRVLPDGTTPLLRAIEGGAPATVTALLWSRDLQEPELRLAQPERERLLSAARHWYGTGAEAELRRRTGDGGPATTSTVDDEWCEAEQIMLGGRTVRAGHGAVLTTLESVFASAAPLTELVARAVRHPDPRHVRPLTAGATAVLRALTQDPDDEVRFDAARILLGGSAPTAWPCGTTRTRRRRTRGSRNSAPSTGPTTGRTRSETGAGATSRRSRRREPGPGGRPCRGAEASRRRGSGSRTR
ncbi:hypothetical protein ACFW2U_22845, partial [Streptomyces sp. NPDC058876]